MNSVPRIPIARLICGGGERCVPTGGGAWRRAPGDWEAGARRWFFSAVRWRSGSISDNCSTNVCANRWMLRRREPSRSLAATFINRAARVRGRRVGVNASSGSTTNSVIDTSSAAAHWRRVLIGTSLVASNSRSSSTETPSRSASARQVMPLARRTFARRCMTTGAVVEHGSMISSLDDWGSKPLLPFIRSDVNPERYKSQLTKEKILNRPLHEKRVKQRSVSIVHEPA